MKEASSHLMAKEDVRIESALREKLKSQTDPEAERMGRTQMMNALGTSHNHDTDETFIIQHGKKAPEEFEGEPGKVIAFGKWHKPEGKSLEACNCYIVLYGSGKDIIGPIYVPMNVPYFADGEEPTFFKPPLWLELLRGAEVRHSYRVKGRKL